MIYSEEYGKSMEAYKLLLEDYTKLTESEQYKDICGTMTFEFLSARQMAETLQLYSEVGNDSRFRWSRVGDAISFYRSVIDLRKNIEHMLESATYVVKASEIAEKINELVDDSPFLPDTLKLENGGKVEEMARECLQLLPKYPGFLTKAFKRSYVESCIDCFQPEDMKRLTDENIIKKADMQNLTLTGTDRYKQNIKVLQEILGVPELLHEHHKIRLAGTSYDNPDGTSRQEFLKELKALKDAILKCTSVIYTPEVGDPKNAVEVSYDGKLIGFVPQDIVNEMFAKYGDPQFDAKLLRVIGGDGAIYGCEVDLGVVAREFAKEETPEKERNA